MQPLEMLEIVISVRDSEIPLLFCQDLEDLVQYIDCDSCESNLEMIVYSIIDDDIEGMKYYIEEFISEFAYENELEVEI